MLVLQLRDLGDICTNIRGQEAVGQKPALDEKYGTLYYAYYTPQLHYRGIALDDDDNMMNECWPWPPISVPLLQHRVAQINPTVLITGWDNVQYMCTVHRQSDDHSVLCTVYMSPPGQAAHQACHPGPHTHTHHQRGRLYPSQRVL